MRDAFAEWGDEVDAFMLVIYARLLLAALMVSGRHGRGHLAPTLRLRRGEPFGQCHVTSDELRLWRKLVTNDG